jgi:hypothetical protein
MAEREPGFYWVKPVGIAPAINQSRESVPVDDCARPQEAEWTIAQWMDCEAGLGWYFWMTLGDEQPYKDADFAEIGERVVRQPSSSFTIDHLVLEKAQIAWPDLSMRARGRITVTGMWPEPQPITDAQKTGERFLVWNENPTDDQLHGWFTARWYPTVSSFGQSGMWTVGSLNTDEWFALDHVTQYLTPPPDVKP